MRGVLGAAERSRDVRDPCCPLCREPAYASRAELLMAWYEVRIDNFRRHWEQENEEYVEGELLEEIPEPEYQEEVEEGEMEN